MKTKNKLKPEQVIKILELYSSGKFTMKQIALKFNTSNGIVANIVNGWTWSYLTS